MNAISLSVCNYISKLPYRGSAKSNNYLSYCIVMFLVLSNWFFLLLFFCNVKKDNINIDLAI